MWKKKINVTIYKNNAKCLNLINLQKKTKKYNPIWIEIPDHLYKILILGGSGSGKTNSLPILINHEREIDKKKFYLKDPYEAVYQLLINKRECKGLKYSNNSKGFIESLHEKPYFPSPGISWKAQKYHGNVIFPSTFWLKKRP